MTNEHKKKLFFEALTKISNILDMPGMYVVYAFEDGQIQSSMMYKDGDMYAQTFFKAVAEHSNKFLNELNLKENDLLN